MRVFISKLLGHVLSNQVHFMEPNQFTRLGAKRDAIPVSDKFRNNDDELIWSTEGRFYRLSGRCHASLVVGQTKARNIPSQKACKTGQMNLIRQDML